MARGRKAAPVLFRADRVDAIGPVWVEQYKLVGNPLIAAFDVLSNLNYISLPAAYHTPSAQLENQVTRYAVANVVERRWNKSVAMALNGKEVDQITRALAETEGALLNTLLNLVIDALAGSDYTSPPALVWAYMVINGGCSLRSRLLSGPESEPSTKAKTVSDFEAATTKLRRGQNPYTDRYTRLVFDIAIAQADKGTGRKADKNSFHARTWLPYLEARADAAKFLRKKGVKMYEPKLLKSK